MSLSGTITQPFCYRNGADRYYLQIVWSASQNVSANTSTVTATVYLGSYGHGYNIVANATKYGYLVLNGTTYNFSTSGINLGSGGKLKLFSKTLTIAHNNDGSKTFNIGAYFNPAVSISGSGSGTVTISTRNVTLNKIPRQSSITSNLQWVVGNNFTITCTLANSAYTNTINLYVNNVWIKRWEGVKTSVNTNFTIAEHTEMFRAMKQQGSTNASLSITTYGYGAQIGNTVSKTGWCSAPYASRITSTKDWTSGYINVINIERDNSVFKHKIEWRVGNTLVHTETNIDTNVTWTLTDSDTATVENLIKNSNSTSGTTTITTYFNGVQIRQPQAYATTVYVNEANRNPIINSTAFYAYDFFTDTISVTGNDRIIIQKLSSVNVKLPANFATARRNADIYSYTIEVGGVRKEVLKNEINATQESDIYIGKINAIYNSQVTVTVKDTRGNTVSTSNPVNIIPYNNMQLNAFARRINGFEETVVLAPNGVIDLLTINGENKQSQSTMSVAWRRKLGSQASFSDWHYDSFAYHVDDNGKWTVTNAQNGGKIYDELDENETAIYEFRASDRFTTATASISIGKGVPIFFIDAEKNSLGVGCFPTKNNEVAMNNTSISGANSISFVSDANDTTQDKLRTNNGTIYLNDQIVFSPNKSSNVLKNTVGVFMNQDHSFTPDKSLYDCEHGWLLVWSKYDLSAWKPVDDNFTFWHIPKASVMFNSNTTTKISKVMCCDGILVMKQLYIHYRAITGHYDNGAGNNRNLVLRYIMEY